MSDETDFFLAINSQTSDNIFITLVTITHDQLTEPIRVADNVTTVLSTGYDGVVSNSIEYTYIGFKFVLPNLEQDALPTTKFTMDNVNREITAVLQDLEGKADATVELVLSKNPNVVQFRIGGLKLGQVTWDVMQLEADFGVEYFMNEPYPAPRFTPSRFPGLFKGRQVEVSS